MPSWGIEVFASILSSLLAYYEAPQSVSCAYRSVSGEEDTLKQPIGYGRTGGLTAEWFGDRGLASHLCRVLALYSVLCNMKRHPWVRLKVGHTGGVRRRSGGFGGYVGPRRTPANR